MNKHTHVGIVVKHDTSGDILNEISAEDLKYDKVWIFIIVTCWTDSYERSKD